MQIIDLNMTKGGGFGPTGGNQSVNFVPYRESKLTCLLK